MIAQIKLVLAAALFATPAAAEMDLRSMQTAQGLAEIVANADHCGYSIDEVALEAYYVEKGLNSPEALSFISGNIDLAKLTDKPSKSQCTMSRATGKSIGLIKG